MKHLKHLFTVLLLLCATVATAYDFEVGGIYYSITYPYTTVKVTYQGSSYYTGSVVIPESVAYNGKTYSVTEIGNYAFQDCTGLTSIMIGNSVTSIGESAFEGCTGLTSIEIPNSVTSIGGLAFRGCTALKDLHIADGNGTLTLGSRVFYDCPLKTLYLGRDLSHGTYNSAPFYSKESLISVTISNNVTRIEKSTFYGCSGLTSVEIPSSVTSIGEWAIRGCSGLTNITIPNSVTRIGDDAFVGCSGLKTVINFSNLTFIKGKESYGRVAYYANKVINAPNGFIDGDFVWSENENGLTLHGCLGDVTGFSLPTEYNGNSVTSIGNSAFCGCNDLTGELVIPNNITSIGTSAFEGCANIEGLYISNSLESIGEKAFAGCEKIKEIKVGLEKPIRGAANIFADAVYDNAILYVPTGTKSLYEKREPWNLFFDIVEMDFTGIENVKGESGTDDRRESKVKTVYDLNGRAVENPTNGIYVVNGKKVLVK